MKTTAIFFIVVIILLNLFLTPEVSASSNFYENPTPPNKHINIYNTNVNYTYGTIMGEYSGPSEEASKLPNFNKDEQKSKFNLQAAIVFSGAILFAYAMLRFLNLKLRPISRKH